MKPAKILVGLLLALPAVTCDIDRGSFEKDNMPAPWFGATPPRGNYEMHRRGWEACLRCGGAERLGANVHVGNLTDLNDEKAREILDAVRAHGVIVIKAQNLTRAQQVEFTSKLGEVIVLPSSFEGKDPEPFHPAIQRITNFWANDTWVSLFCYIAAEEWMEPKN